MNFKDLNERQTEALLQTEGPVLILAGAGSGKTKVVTNKIAYLIQEKNIFPSSILAITFTNKAAKEMLQRVDALIEEEASSMWIGTFHAICVRILRKNIERLGYTSSFTIYDTADQNTVVSDCIKELNLNKDMYKSRGVLATISKLKNEDVQPDEYINQNYVDFYARNVGEIYALYQKKLKSNNALDFDDLIIKSVELLEKFDDVKKYYNLKFKYVFVDEYQDTNNMQYRFIKLISGDNPNITVVGDNDQSIYAWRGADISNILNFENDYKNAKVILLEQNYRSTSNILNIANNVISNNTNRKDKNLWTSKDGGEKVKYRQFRHSSEEEQGVVEKIQQLNYSGYNYSDMAILYRTNAQSRGFEEALVRESIPYRIVGGLKFYDRKEVKDIIAYLKLIQNTNDDIALLRIINVPKRGIGDSTMTKIAVYAQEHGLSLYDVISNHDIIDNMQLRAQKKIKEFRDLIELLRNHIEDLPLSEFVERVIYESGYVRELEAERTIEARARIENIKELLSTAVESEKRDPDVTLEDFLSGVSLLSDVDKSSENKGVNLMTVHASKGLEFKVVFLVGMEENLFPSIRSSEEDEDVEEERRLCYVAITRAEEQLFISSSETRTMYGRTSPCLESRFIEEMGEELDKERPKVDYTYKSKLVDVKDYVLSSAKRQETETKKSDNLNLSVGDKVFHKKWKNGMIVSKTPKGDDYEIVVSFEGQGLKRLMLSLAPLKLVK